MRNKVKWNVMDDLVNMLRKLNIVKRWSDGYMDYIDRIGHNWNDACK